MLQNKKIIECSNHLKETLPVTAVCIPPLPQRPRAGTKRQLVVDMALGQAVIRIIYIKAQGDTSTVI
jgi:hypothetical protein